ncbi:hypothetical protein StoSoilA2_14250 [Arthrobacter sp. StoSoilA2]|uniref:Ig-like domain-containing protein n=1 Tax=Arthrobacter sp. StoSoilA2 TaxID=2830990 RepID=UPI001CC75444|nr:Ig-like domain-containing protein [Arthrobacter sp. StoSoilA2]BCW35369.1 hypothetical protein StoSoilA2_14250 [Arthrobacter sp. StoSoilA2]
MRDALRERLLSEAALHAQTHPADLDRALGEGMSTIRRRLVRTWVVVIVAAVLVAAGLVAVRVLLDRQPAVLESIAVSAPASSLQPGAILQLSAEATYSDGTRRPLQDGVEWASDNLAVAETTADGQATAVAPGVAGLTATLDGVSGRFELKVTPPGTASLTALRITPGDAETNPGGKVPLVAEGTYSDGSLGRLNVTAIWASRDPGIATVDGDGLVTAAAPGTAIISASQDGFEATARITVNPAPPAKLSGLAIEPAELTIKQGQTHQMTAVASYTDGSTKPESNVTWSTSNPKIATISASGLLTAQGIGQVLIEAKHVDADGKEWKAQSKVTVEHAVIRVVVGPAGPHALEPGATVQLTATVTYSDGKPGKPVIAWASSRPVIATVSNGLVRGGPVQGQVTITATVEGVSSNGVVVSVGPTIPTQGPVKG